MEKKDLTKASGPFDLMTMEVTVPFTSGKKAPFFVVALSGLALAGLIGSAFWIKEYNKNKI